MVYDADQYVQRALDDKANDVGMSGVVERVVAVSAPWRVVLGVQAERKVVPVDALRALIVAIAVVGPISRWLITVNAAVCARSAPEARQPLMDRCISGVVSKPAGVAFSRVGDRPVSIHVASPQPSQVVHSTPPTSLMRLFAALDRAGRWVSEVVLPNRGHKISTPSAHTVVVGSTKTAGVNGSGACLGAARRGAWRRIVGGPSLFPSRVVLLTPSPFAGGLVTSIDRALGSHLNSLPETVPNGV